MYHNVQFMSKTKHLRSYLQVALDCPHSVPRMHLQASASLPCRCLLSCSIQVARMSLKRIQHIFTASNQGIPPSSLAIHTLRLRAQSKAQGEGTKPRHKQSMSSAMQPNKLAISRASPPRFMLVSDLDHTMVSRTLHTHASLCAVTCQLFAAC